MLSGKGFVDLPWLMVREVLLPNTKADVMFSDMQSLASESTDAAYSIETSCNGIEFDKDRKNSLYPIRADKRHG